MKKRLIVLAVMLVLVMSISGCTSYDPVPDTMYFNNLVVVGPQWDDVRTPVNSIKLPQINPPVETVYKGSLVLTFQDVAAPQEQIAYFAIQIPHSYKEGTAISPHIHWAGSDASAGNVVWTLTYSWANMLEVFPAQTSDTQAFANSTTLDTHNVGHFLDVAGTGKKVSSMLLCSLKRNSSNGSDTYTGAAYLLEVDIHIQVESLGSVHEENKP